MENLYFSPAVPPDAVLSRFEVCRTHDLDEARQWGEKIFCANRLRSLDAPGPLNTRIYYRRLGGIGVGRMSYGADISIELGAMETFSLVQMPIRGQERIDIGAQRVLSDASKAVVLNAHSPLVVNNGRSTEKLVIRIDSNVLERHCRKHLGRSLDRPVEFQPEMPLDTPQGRRWMRMVGWLYDSLSVDDGDLPPMLVSQFESNLVNLLLACQRHNYSAELLGEDGPVVTPSFVKRVERYIEEHAHEPITIADMAESVGVSSRKLFVGFRRYRNTSPMQYLKEVRLRNVYEELARQSNGSVTVTAVAYRWGFSHLGHFATDYRRRFDETPSQTLGR